ncbi:MAG: hypothetical protein A2X31_04510 [Elusimicrobia bacterium GWB2_63_22]|nr:MAG: hypothetical protein A2X31_04510 [Elusimicrobia bacterium GWB2_63_22]
MKSNIKTISSGAALAVLLLLAGGATPALAAVPELINFQGKLTDPAGTAITGSVPMVFKFYAAASGGASLWSETQNVTPDSDGIYSVMLGLVTPFGIPFSNAYWLGVTVGADSEMLPRYRVVSSAYSLYSLNSATAAYSVNSGTAAWAQGAAWASITSKPAAGAASDGYLTSVDWNIFNGKLSASGDGSLLTGITAGQLNLGSVNNTSDADKPVSTLQQAALNLKANLAGATFSGNIFAGNLAGTNTGDQTAVSGNAGTVTNGVYTVGDQTIGGIKTFSSAIVGSVSGNAGTVTTNADLTGVVTSVGNATSIANGAITNAMLFNGAVANLSGTNTGDQVNITGNAATVTTNANLTGVVTSVGNATSIANGAITNAMLFNGAVANLSGTNTGDQTTISGNAGTVTNGVYTIGDQTIGGIKTFSSPIVGSVSGNAGTVTTNANLTGVVTSVGNATSIANGAITNAMLFNGAVANLSGTNTGDQTAISGNAGTVTNGVYTIGDQTIGGIKTFSSAIVGSVSGNAGTVTTNANLTGDVTSVGNATTLTNAPVIAKVLTGYVSGAGVVAATDSILQAIQKLNGNIEANTGDVLKAADQTFTGLNTFTSAVTAKGYANASQSVVLTNETSFAADGSGVVGLTFSGTAIVTTITGCSSGAVGQGQLVVFVASAWTVGGISFGDTTPAAAAPDTLLLNGAAGTWTPPASAACLGAAITLMCTTVNTATPGAPNYVKLWVEIGRSLSGV